MTMIIMILCMEIITLSDSGEHSVIKVYTLITFKVIVLKIV